MYNIPGWSVIFNKGAATEHIDAYLYYHSKVLAQNVKHILQEIGYFLSLINNLSSITLVGL